MAKKHNGEDTQETLLRFPCDFTIKIFGYANEEFEKAALGIIHKHADLSDRAIASRASANGKYLALTVTVRVESKEQLDKIYQELSSSPQIIMAL